ncbi:ROK family transcriptional regulator [Shimia aestuarii]|uniref:Sugar kinase of the NBD/HSP70 family, may contain an N-terminal HTH domain n=1 Tax=Shimia aestuarii TaxID=254406 RepID=A0A1I4RZ32_9RHOB|nr:ROK family transcriptional regulator [Shimia aestuarii]SFM57431.1 Sugar kinase of the NBD/HSP70 family, may contain an N-terminal HTH domain [Shimia aestuarii]
MSVNQREFGRRVLLGEIRKHRRIARINLADHTGISRATVTTITAELLREGLIEEVPGDSPERDGKRGRPTVDLRIRGAAHLVAGAKISNRTISLVLLDFEGNQLADHEVILDQNVFEAQELAGELATHVEVLARKIDRQRTDISGLGVGIAGIVDAPRGFVHWSPLLDQRNVEFGRVLSDALSIPVYLDNDANLVAVAEKTFGLGQGHSDFIVVTIESGVGMGLYIGDEIYRGTRGCGAEFGHTKVQLDGALCRCGQRGCLEAYVADYALLREAMIASGDKDGRPVEALLRDAQEGDAVAKSIVDRAGRMFAMGLANLVNIFDPELIILAGEQMQASHLYAEEVIEAIRASIVQIDKAPPEVVIHKWGNLMWARGAAAYALDNVSEAALAEMADHAG